MKIKLLSILAILSLAIVFSCKDPQKEAQKKADQENKMADKEESKAEDKLSSGVEHAENAMEHRTAAAMNEALANVQKPEFENNEATMLVTNLGNDAVEFANSDNFEEGGRYADKIRKHLSDLAKKVQDGKITQAESDQITTYAQNLATAMGIQL